MIYQLGVLILLGSMSGTWALPSCVCPRNLQPVCGSNGQTYSNECTLQCVQVSNPEVTLVRTGRCENIDNDANCACTLEYRPMCGTDGKTYPNRCAITCPRQSIPVEVAYEGPCKEKRDNVLVSELPDSGCTCPRNVDPVCGSDGSTYENTCIFDCYKERNPELSVRHVGSCEKAPCQCTREARLVCGSDGNTYSNPCMLACAKEQGNTDLEVQYFGKCEIPEVADPPSCTCTREMKPVCGTDGNSYSNPCLLNCARENNDNLHIDYMGFCDNSVEVVEKAENVSCACTRNLKPVCASNGVTFNNECLMRCSGTHLTVANEGPCEE